MCFSSPKIPAPTIQPPPPIQDEAASRRAGDVEQRRLRAAAGRKSTMLTSGSKLGAGAAQPTLLTKSLLGG